MNACTRYPDDEVVLRYVTGDLDEPEPWPLRTTCSPATLPGPCGALPGRPAGARQPRTAADACRRCQRRDAGHLAARLRRGGCSSIAASAHSRPRGRVPGARRSRRVAWPRRQPALRHASSSTPRGRGVPPAEQYDPSRRGPRDGDAAALSPIITRGDRDAALPRPWRPTPRRLDGRLRDLARSTRRSPLLPGVADLMRGEGAARRLRPRVVRAIGRQPYARESLFYLGKAALQRGDVGKARGRSLPPVTPRRPGREARACSPS